MHLPAIPKNNTHNRVPDERIPLSEKDLPLSRNCSSERPAVLLVHECRTGKHRGKKGQTGCDKK
jgi:hypothetical protein